MKCHPFRVVSTFDGTWYRDNFEAGVELRLQEQELGTQVTISSQMDPEFPDSVDQFQKLNELDA